MKCDGSLWRKVTEYGESRRSEHRYSADGTVRYRVLRGGELAVERHGRMINLSSGSILFEAAGAIPIGANIELSIPWPSLLPNQLGLEVHVTGLAVREQSRCIAVKIVHHEFKLAHGWLSEHPECQPSPVQTSL